MTSLGEERNTTDPSKHRARNLRIHARRADLVSQKDISRLCFAIMLKECGGRTIYDYVQSDYANMSMLYGYAYAVGIHVYSQVHLCTYDTRVTDIS